MTCNICIYQGHTRTQEQALINEGSTREIPATLPKHVSHLYTSEGSKHAIPVTVSKTCLILAPNWRQ
jgi:hypothetical protein